MDALPRFVCLYFNTFFDFYTDVKSYIFRKIYRLFLALDSKFDEDS